MMPPNMPPPNLGPGMMARQMPQGPNPMMPMGMGDLGPAPVVTGLMLYGNPVLEAPPFDESMFGDLVTPAQSLGMESNLSLGMDSGSSMPMAPGASLDPMSGDPEVKEMMRALLQKKAQDRLAASQGFQDMAHQMSGQGSSY